MATDPGTVEFLLDQLGTRGASYSTRRMFGEYCLYREGLPVAFVCDDVLFIKDTPAGRDSMSAAGLLDFGPPYPGAKDYLRLPPDGWDEGQWLRGLLDATAAALPAPRVRKADLTPGANAKKTHATKAAPKVRKPSFVKKPSTGKPTTPAKKTSSVAKTPARKVAKKSATTAKATRSESPSARRTRKV
ncbi:TfoX/Sxy family protein [Lysobacter claricitrinus]|uniref:TfoX/Sxy family protein n=1 Tax=Lysobacter claricitrinus TaxID=3367728 RepID=UPI0037DA7DEB